MLHRKYIILIFASWGREREGKKSSTIQRQIMILTRTSDRMIANFIAESVKKLAETDSNSTYYMELDDDLALYVGWGHGFDPDDSQVFHSKSDPDCVVCVKLAEWNPVDIDYEWMYMPVYTNGEVYDTDSSIGLMTDYRRLANELLHEYDVIREKLNSGELKF